MRTLAKGRTPGECQRDVDNKTKRGWHPVSKMVYDDTLIEGRFVCVMEKPDQPQFNKRKFNQYIGY